VQWVINFLTFWILLSYMVPISLFVTLEVVKFWQVRPLAGQPSPSPQSALGGRRAS
jgi:magnesium-transporting ATPase (P-type)